MITTEQVKSLRDQTGVSVMRCKQALEEADGDMEQALQVLRQKSGEAAHKKSDRETQAGLIATAQDAGHVSVVTLHCETDFVAQNDEFQKFADTIAQQALTDPEAAQAYAQQAVAEVIQKIGENIQIGDIHTHAGDPIAAYVHNTDQAAVVSLSGGSTDLAYEIAMHAVAMKPAYITPDDITEEDRQSVRDMFKQEVDAMSDKPEDIREKILSGKEETHFNEQTLLIQNFVKNPEQTVGDLLTDAGATIEEVTLYHV